MLKVLFLGARPRNAHPLALKQEVQKIVFRLSEAPHGTRIKIVDEWAIQFTDVPGLLISHRPDIVHFSGHGNTQSELLFEDDLGTSTPVPKEALLSLFQTSTAGGVRCLLLNACFTGELAQELCQHVDFVIGTRASIQDRAAIAFAETFYSVLAHGQSVDEAYQMAKSQFQVYADKNQPLPELFMRQGADPQTRLLSANEDTKNSATSQEGSSNNETPGNREALVTAYRMGLRDQYRIWQRDPLLLSHRDMGYQRTVPFEDAFYEPQLRAADGSRTTDMMGLLSSLNSGARMLIQAPGGMGKTTWLKALFRELLAPGKALPVMLDLRALATLLRDQAKPEQERSIDGAIHMVGSRVAIPGWSEGWPTLLTNGEACPGLMLLLDGWDEAGPMGREIREKLLSFLARYPRTGVIVTSRYYGDDLPTIQDGFARWFLLPLSDDDIRNFAQRYFNAFHSTNQDSAAALKQFCEALQSSASGVRELAHTPLLLTMMLENFAEIPLPSKRHLLYEECIRLLLTARPDKKTADGALLAERCFRPDDAHERKSAAAALAAGILTSPDVGGHTWEALERLLPHDWPPDATATERTEKRKGFLAWLVGPAGLLVQDEATGRLGFVNQCIQEYLAAWHYHETMEGDMERSSAFAAWSAEARFREMLLLWASLMHGTDVGRKTKRLSPILTALQSAGAKQRDLAGAILASGAGDEAAFARWLTEFPQLASSIFPENFLETRLYALIGVDFPSDEESFSLAAWANSAQEERKLRMTKCLITKVMDADVLDRIAYLRLARRCGLSLEEPTVGINGVGLELLTEVLAPSFSERRKITIGRLLSDLDPGSLSHKHGLAMIPLLIYRSQRRTVGQLLQCAAALGAQRNELRGLAAKLLRPLPTDEETMKRQMDSWASMLGGLRAAQEKKEGWYPHKEIEAALRDYHSSLAIAFNLHIRPWDKSDPSENSLPLGETIWHSLTRITSDALRRYSSQSSLRGLGLKELLFKAAGLRLLAWFLGLPPETKWLPSYAMACLPILSGASDGELVLKLQGSPLEFFILAYRASMMSFDKMPQSEFQQALSVAASGCDPFYIALAKHIARLATAEDRTFLEDVILGRDSRPDPLRSMIEAVIRGDIETNEGRITLDELSSECNLPSLPLLEAPPLEFQVDPGELEKRIELAKLNKAVSTKDWTAAWRSFLAGLKNASRSGQSSATTTRPTSAR